MYSNTIPHKTVTNLITRESNNTIQKMIAMVTALSDTMIIGNDEFQNAPAQIPKQVFDACVKVISIPPLRLALE